MKKNFLVFLVLLVVSVGFSNLDVSYNQIMKNFDFMVMESHPLAEGTPRYIGKYGPFAIEVVGNKTRPKQTTFTFDVADDEKVTNAISVFLVGWINNTVPIFSEVVSQRLMNLLTTKANELLFDEEFYVSSYKIQVQRINVMIVITISK